MFTLIEWESSGGCTMFDEDGTPTLFVPPADSPYTRSVRRHEVLHATYDGPDKAGGHHEHTHGQQGQISDTGELATQAVGDLFVHLVYWPEDWTTGLPKTDAVEAAFIDLRNCRRDKNHWDADRRATLLITARALAILQKLGTSAEQAEGAKLAAEIVTPAQLAAFHHIYALVEGRDRAEADKQMARLMEGVG